MLVIFIRGVPGVGKTTVSKILEERLPNSEAIYVDNFKIKAMKKGYTFNKAQKIAYNQTLQKLYFLHKKNKNYIILEEIISEKDFLRSLIEFLNETKSNVYWFRLMRPIEKLLKIESNRKRKIKNSHRDLLKFKQDIEFLKIKNEYWIKNDNLAFTIKKILNIVH